jgi:hypoxanthine phosphoribosyltransferase
VKAPLPAGLSAVLYDEAEIAAAVERLAREIARDSAGEPLLLVGVLKGALFLTADLARALSPHLDVRLDFVGAASYGASSRSSGTVRLLSDLSASIADQHVVVVDDIVDEGRTLHYLLGLLAARGPATLRSCALLDKPERRVVQQSADYVGFTVPDEFIVGYGLDYQEKYRQLPYLATLGACGVGDSSLGGCDVGETRGGPEE